MSKLTKKQTKQLESVLYHLKRAEKYIFSAETAVAHRTRFSTTTLDYVRASDGATLYEVEREYGSDLCGLRDAIKGIERILFPPLLEMEDSQGGGTTTLGID